jgi:hypothetical protein
MLRRGEVYEDWCGCEVGVWMEVDWGSKSNVNCNFKVKVRTKIKSRINITIKIKRKSNGDGQECPSRMGWVEQQGAGGVGRDAVYGEGGAQGICYGEALWGQPAV